MVRYLLTLPYFLKKNDYQQLTFPVVIPVGPRHKLPVALPNRSSSDTGRFFCRVSTFEND